jgi:hypothetical protein
MGLLSARQDREEVGGLSITLLAAQQEDASWSEPQFTGTTASGRVLPALRPTGSIHLLALALVRSSARQRAYQVNRSSIIVRMFYRKV